MSARVYRVGPSPFYRSGGVKAYDTAANEGDVLVVEATTQPDRDGDLTGVIARTGQTDAVSPDCLTELLPGDRPVVDVEDLEAVIEALGGSTAGLPEVVAVAQLVSSARR